MRVAKYWKYQICKHTKKFSFFTTWSLQRKLHKYVVNPVCFLHDHSPYWPTTVIPPTKYFTLCSFHFFSKHISQPTKVCKSIYINSQKSYFPVESDFFWKFACLLFYVYWLIKIFLCSHIWHYINLLIAIHPPPSWSIVVSWWMTCCLPPPLKSH